MNRIKFKACLILLQGSNSLSSSSLLQCVSKCSTAHLSRRTYFLNLILGDRKFNLPPHVEKKQEENVSFQSFSLYETFKIRQERKSKICDILECSLADASDILQHASTQSQLDDPEMFFEKLNCLRVKGLDSKIILNNMWLFKFSLGDLEKKLEAFCSRSSEEFRLNEIALLKLSRSDLVELLTRLKQEKENNLETRIDFFSREFKLTVPEVCGLLVERSFLRRKNLETIVSMFTMLLEAGVTREEIKNDFWIFKMKKETLEKRIEVAKEYKFDRFKCWMSRCTLRALKRSAEIVNNNKEVLTFYHSKEELLQKKLELSTEEVKRILTIYPQLLKVREMKLKYMIDFLLAENLTPQQIVRHPRVLCHSPKKLMTRINELRRLNVDIECLYWLGLKQEAWDNYIDRILSIEEESKDEPEACATSARHERKPVSNRS